MGVPSSPATCGMVAIVTIVFPMNATACPSAASAVMSMRRRCSAPDQGGVTVV